MNYNALFNSNGKIPTWSDFFKGEGSDIFTSKNGIVDGYKTVLGEQIIHTRLPYRTPIYSLGISAPLLEGDGWTERLINPTTTYKLNPKATAQDDLGVLAISVSSFAIVDTRSFPAIASSSP